MLVFSLPIYRDHCIEMNLHILSMVLGTWKSVCQRKWSRTWWEMLWRSPNWIASGSSWGRIEIFCVPYSQRETAKWCCPVIYREWSGMLRRYSVLTLINLLICILLKLWKVIYRILIRLFNVRYMCIYDTVDQEFLWYCRSWGFM